MGRKQVTAGESDKEFESDGRGAQITKTAEEKPPVFGETRPGAEGGRGVIRGGLDVARSRAAEAEAAAKAETALAPGAVPPGLGPPEEGVLGTGEPAAGPPIKTEPNILQQGVEHPQTPPRPARGGAGLRGEVTLERTIGPQVPGELVAAQAAVLTRGAQLAALGYQARADALGIEVDILQEHEEILRDNLEPTLKQYDAILTQAEQEAQEIDQLIEIAQSDRINPGQFFENIGGAGRFAAALAMGASAMANIFAGGNGPGTATRIIQNAIDRNVRSQTINMLHNRALIQHQSNFTHTLKSLAKDRGEYGNYVRVATTALAAANVNVARAALGESLHQMAAMQVYNQLDAKLIEAKINAITASQTKATIKLKSLSQVSAAMSAFDAVQGGGTQKPIAARGGAGRGGAAQGGAGRDRGASSAPAQSIAASVLQRVPTGGSPQQIAATAAEQLRNQAGQSGATRDELLAERDRISDALGRIPDVGMSAKAEFDRRDIDDVLPLDRMDLLPEGLAIGNERRAFRITENFNPKKRQEAISEVSQAANNVLRAQRVMELLQTASQGGRGALLRHLRVIDGEVFFFPPSDPKQRVRVAELDNHLTALVQTLRNLGGDSRNAVNTMGEFEFMGRLTQDRVDVATQIVNAVAKDGNLNAASFSPVLGLTKTLFNTKQNAYGLEMVLPGE